MERGVVVGGLMIVGSFLLAALLNRSAMEEVPASSAAAPVNVVAPMSPAVSATDLAPGPEDCGRTEEQVDSLPAPAEAEQPTPDRCGISD